MQGEITQIKASLEEISKALLGSFDKSGIIEGHRNLAKVVETQAVTIGDHVTQIRAHSAQIEDIQSFKRDAKRIVGWIAILIPIVFEFIKFAGSWAWELFSKK